MDLWTLTVVPLLVSGCALMLVATGKGLRGLGGGLFLTGLVGLSLSPALHLHPRGGQAPSPPRQMSLADYPHFQMIGQSVPVGEEAPDFTLPDIRTGEMVTLSEVLTDKPMVLIFGSWGCNVFCGQFSKLAMLEQAYRGRAEFLFVEVMDAPHELPHELSAAYAAAGYHTRELRDTLPRAAFAANVMGSPFRQLLDTVDGDACWKYKAFPERLVLIQGGKIIYDAGQGIHNYGSGWDMAEVRRFLDRALTRGTVPE